MLENKKQTEKKIYFILEQAPLKIATVGKEIVLLNSEDHQQYIKTKLNKDPFFFRPDVLH